MEFACGIDDYAIELEVLNRLRDRSILKHISGCYRCQGRVFEHRNWIGHLRLVLRDAREDQESQETPNNPYGSSPGSGE
jgi:hypothetical protein